MMDMDKLSEDERIIAEQSVVAFQAVLQAGRGAVHGQGMNSMEVVVQEKGMEILRKMLELSASDHAESKKMADAARPARA